MGVKRWTGEVEGRLVDQRPLAGSVDIVEEQRNSVQVGTLGHVQQVNRSITPLPSPFSLPLLFHRVSQQTLRLTGRRWRVSSAP